MTEDKSTVVVEGNKKVCERHKPIVSKLPYIQSFDEAERRMKRGQKQKQCPKCLHWYFKDEF